MRQKRAIKKLRRIRKIYNSRMKWEKWRGVRDRYLGRIVDVSGAHKVAIVVAH